MENISKHITYNEAVNSPTGMRLKIDNTPNALQLAAMKLVAEKCFEPLRVWYNNPIHINSFFRCYALNTAVGGSKTSDHMNGCSIDLSGGDKTENEILFNWCKDHLEFDQLINEYDFTWVHISYRATGNRKQIKVIK